jgi:hypothetical protein
MELPQTKKVLLETMKNDRFSERTRCKAAASLVRLGEPAGGEFLLDRYGRYLETLKSPQQRDWGEARSDLELLGDSQLIAALKARAAAEPPGVPKNNLSTLLDTMAVSAMSIEQLKSLAAEGGGKHLDLRLHAIRVIGRRGGSDIIPFLESLRTRPGEFTRPDFNQMWQNYLRAAIVQIRMRHWQQSG